MLQERHGDHWIPVVQLEDAIVEARGAENLLGLRAAVNRRFKGKPAPK